MAQRDPEEIRPDLNPAIHTLRDLNLAVRGPFTNMRRQRIYVVEDCILTESEILALRAADKLTMSCIREFLAQSCSENGVNNLLQ